MGCTDCNDNKIPTTIPVGSDGKSVTIAYASDNVGTGFSYTPTVTLKYISFVVKSTAVAQSDFTTWTKYIGDDGADGNDGVSVDSAVLSDGITSIGGTVYDENSLIIGLDNGTYINAGVIEPVWQTLNLLNGWSTESGLKRVPEYAIFLGFIHFRGVLDFRVGSPTSTTFGVTNTISNLTLPGSDSGGNTYCAVVEDGGATPSTNYVKLALTVNTITLSFTTAVVTTIHLDSMPPISYKL